MTYKFILPTSVILPRKTKDDKKIQLNMNVYRNLNHFTNNQIKQEFRPIKIEIFRAEKIRISYFVEKRTKRIFDTRNITDVVDKYFLDWLVKMKMIPDDNFNHVCYGREDGINDCEHDRVVAMIEVIK